jgi:hypothetical protein
MAKQSEELLPRISKNPVLSKSVWVGIFTTILAYLVSGAITLVKLTSGQIMSTGFFATLVIIFIIAEAIDLLNGNKYTRYLMQNVLGALLVAMLLGTVLSFIGITSIALNIASGLGILIGTTALFYIGAYFVKKYIQ